MSILELACSIEVPRGGEGWQQLRKGHLPSEFTNGLSVSHRTLTPMSSLQTLLRLICSHDWILVVQFCHTLRVSVSRFNKGGCVCVCVALSPELQHVLRLMLAPEPRDRATVEQLLSLRSVRKHRWRRQVSLRLRESWLSLLTLGQVNTSPPCVCVCAWC